MKKYIFNQSKLHIVGLLLLSIFMLSCSKEEVVITDLPSCEGELLEISSAIAIDAQDNIWFTRNNKFYTLSPQGVETEIAGTGESTLEDGSFRSAKHLSWHPDGYLLFIDPMGTLDNWVRKVTTDGNITSVALSPIVVADMAISQDGKVYLSLDLLSSGRARIYELKDDVFSEVMENGFDYIYGLAFDTNNDLYFTTGSALFKLNDDATAEIISGHSTESGDVQGTKTQARYSYLQSLTVTTNNVFYLADKGANKVLRITGNQVDVFASQENDNTELPISVKASSSGNEIYVRLNNNDTYRFTCQ